jgi:PKD repeat protein
LATLKAKQRLKINPVFAGVIHQGEKWIPAAFIVNPDNGFMPESVTFSDSSTGTISAVENLALASG